MEILEFKLRGEALQIVGHRNQRGNAAYDVMLNEMGQVGLSLDELRKLCDALSRDLVQLPYTDLVFGPQAGREISMFEEASKHAHRADADGAHGA